jgi:hypothetical protein
MPEVRRILEAAAALSEVLTNAGVSHAFHGSVITAVLSDGRQCDVCADEFHLSSLSLNATWAIGDFLHRRGGQPPSFPSRARRPQ